MILVEDVLKTLQQLAAYHREQLQIPFFALTGSNGKTTTKELINVVLQKKYKTKATFGNLNNHIGVPLTVLSIDTTIEFAIIEMGANHHKEIEFLASIVSPDYGYITNFGKAHLEGFGSVKGVVEAKSELYDNIIKNDKTIFVNGDDKIQVDKTKNTNKEFLNTNVNLMKTNPYLVLNYEGEKLNTHLVGDYNFNNIRVAITLGEYFGISKQDIIDAIESYIPSNNRSQIIEVNTNKIILDAYNANPTSMEAAINNFKQVDAVDKVIVLGDMFELGKYSALEHQKIVDLLANHNFNKVFLLGENFSRTKTNFKTYKTFNDFILDFKSLEFNDTTFLIKGSRGMKLERTLEFIDLNSNGI